MAEAGWQAYAALMDHVRQTGRLGGTLALAGWDQEAMMPAGSGAVAYRGRQMAQLAGLVHERRVDQRVGDWLAACEQDEEVVGDPASVPAVNVREVRRDFDRATRLPRQLVEAFSEATTVGRDAWKRARAADDFSIFAPQLEHLVELNRQRALCFGWEEGEEAWDALAEGFEPGMRAAQVARLFEPLRDELTQLLGKVVESGRRVEDHLAKLEIPVEQQRLFVREVARRVGFDFERGRLDESTHPFCSGLHRDDVRMTTKLRPGELLDGLTSTLHETGHGLYEQGLPGGEHVDTPFGQAVGLGIHESQSRLIENQLGRSRAFWGWCAEQMAEAFGPAVRGLSAEGLWRSANIVQPSLIRVESDETTYNLHIMVRFELERALLDGLTVAELPGAWNEAYERYLGVRPDSDADGVMQDIHWSQGAMGYFPTYTLGNLYAAQFYEQMAEDVGDVDGAIAAGEFDGVVGWLREKIHSQGRRWQADELCEQVTGKRLEAGALLRYLKRKAGEVYGIEV